MEEGVEGGRDTGDEPARNSTLSTPCAVTLWMTRPAARSWPRTPLGTAVILRTSSSLDNYPSCRPGLGRA